MQPIEEVILNNIDVENVTIPEAGQTPAFTGTIPSDVNYILIREAWFTKDMQNWITSDNAVNALIPKANKIIVFVSGEEYVYAAYVGVCCGYLFDLEDKLIGTVNGDNACSVQTMTDNYNVDITAVVFYKAGCPAEEYTLTFVTNGGSEVSPVTRRAGTVEDLNSYSTVKENAEFKGWYAESELENLRQHRTEKGCGKLYDMVK